MFQRLIIVYVVYIVYLLLRRGYIQSFAEQLRPYIKRRRIWVGLALGPLWFLVTRLIRLYSFIFDDLELARSIGSEIEQVVQAIRTTISAGTIGVIFTSGETIVVVISAVILILVALWVLFCLIKAWRNTVAMKTARRHLEALDLMDRQLQQET